jgi:hypothetical protein
MLPVITAFMAAHQLPEVTIVADSGMISEANQKAIEDAGLSFILGIKDPGRALCRRRWRREHPGQDLPDGQVLTQPWPATGGAESRRPPGQDDLLPVPRRSRPPHSSRRLSATVCIVRAQRLGDNVNKFICPVCGALCPVFGSFSLVLRRIRPGINEEWRGHIRGAYGV